MLSGAARRMPRPKYKSRYDIYARILKFCEIPRNIASIMEFCSLSGTTVYKHVTFLSDKGLLSKIETPSLRKPLLMTTLKGLRYLKYYGKLRKLIDEQ